MSLKYYLATAFTCYSIGVAVNSGIIDKGIQMLANPLRLEKSPLVETYNQTQKQNSELGKKSGINSELENKFIGLDRL